MTYSSETVHYCATLTKNEQGHVSGANWFQQSIDSEWRLRADCLPVDRQRSVIQVTK
jgi:hypothetical protein